MRKRRDGYEYKTKERGIERGERERDRETEREKTEEDKTSCKTMTNEDGDERRRRQEEAHIIYYLSSKFNIDLFFTPTNTQDFEDIYDGLMHFLID